MKITIKKLLSLLLSAIMLFMLNSFSISAADTLSLPKIFTDNMVLQRNKPINVWGKGVKGETVTVILNDKSVSTTVIEEDWLVQLPTMNAGGPYELVVISGSQAKTYKNVMLGEVWLCAGQSNMEWSIQHPHNQGGINADTYNLMTRYGDYPDIRIFAQHGKTANKWESGKSYSLQSEAPSWSVVAMHFAAKMYEEYGVPIGIVQAAEGNTTIEAFMTQDMLDNPTQLYTLKAQEGSHKLRYAYDKYIEHLIPMTMQGILWYQGEANNVPCAGYGDLQERMIMKYREFFGQDDLSFIYAQLPAYHLYGFTNSQNWQYFREEQEKTLNKDLYRVAMVGGLDIYSAESIHPIHKSIIGERMAISAMAIAYSKDVEYKNPSYESHEFDGNKAIVTFKDVGQGGLGIGGKYYDSPINGFQLAQADGRFQNADAVVVDKDKIELTAPGITNPQYIRFHFVQAPIANLYSLSSGLPVLPFRTEHLTGADFGSGTNGYIKLPDPMPVLKEGESQKVINSTQAVVVDGYPGFESNNCAGQTLFIRTEDQTRILLEYDIKSNLPKNATITSAILRFKENNRDAWVELGTSWFEVFKVNSSWDKNTVTWNTQPSHDKNIKYGEYKVPGHMEYDSWNDVELDVDLFKEDDALNCIVKWAGWSFQRYAAYNYFKYVQLIVNYEEDKPETIEMLTEPDNTDIYQFEEIDVAGAQIFVEYKSGDTDTVEVTSAMISGFDNTIVGKQAVTVSYMGVTCSLDVNVIDNPIMEINLKSEPYKKEYLLGEELDLTGGVIALTYKSKLQRDFAITPQMVSGYNAYEEGEQVLTVTYKEGLSVDFLVKIIGIPLPPRLKGFITNGGNNADISIQDAIAIFRHLADKVLLIDEDDAFAADIDGKNGITIQDAIYIFRYLADKLTMEELQAIHLEG